MAELLFHNRVAIITGAGQGLGRAQALALAERGAAVVVNDLGTTVNGEGADSGPANAVVGEIVAAGGQAVADTGTVSVVEDAQRMVGAALERFGRIDIVINNAGIATKGGIGDVELSDLVKHLEVHVIGSFNVTKAAWPHLVAQGYGRVVIMTSSAFLGRSDVISYSAAKAAQIGMTKSLAREGEAHDIKVNALAPAAYTRMGNHWTTLPNGEKQPVAVENTAAAAAVLAHECCPVTGEVFGVGTGHIDRLYFAGTIGHTIDAVLTPSTSSRTLTRSWTTASRTSPSIARTTLSACATRIYYGTRS
jgi:NAD(P)-dependent dehydrogenase (short-subunit alcohol dehydrogenase family)